MSSPDAGPPPDTRSRVAMHLPAVLGLAVVVRVPFWIEALRTPLDGDTAIIGLMARHPGQGTTMWGQPYGSPVEAWLAWPVLALLGPKPENVRLFYFLMGLALPALAYLIALRLDRRAALPAGVLLACPPGYFLLLSALPPPLYPTALVLSGVLIVLALRLGERFAAEEEPGLSLFCWGLLAGLALWTHLMTASVAAAGLAYLWLRAEGRRLRLLFALVPLLAASSPWWTQALVSGDAGVLNVSARRVGFEDHLLSVLPRLHEPAGGILGTHTPLIADDPDHVVLAPAAARAGLILIYGVALILAARLSRGRGPAGLLFGVALLALLAFPFPVRSHPGSLRFLTVAYLPVAALVAWVPAAQGSRRRAWILVLALALLHLLGGARLLEAWRSADRAQAPFLLPDLGPLREFLEARGIRRAYASYGPAWRLTFESGERIVASQPWNERFLHVPLPYLDEVRFAKDVAWVLTPAVPTGLPAPHAFEDALHAAGGTWTRTRVGGAVVYHGFVPPFAPEAEPPPGSSVLEDRDLATGARPVPGEPVTVTLPTPRTLAGVTLLAPLGGARLPRALDVEVTADGRTWTVVAQRRRRGERDDLRWVNGHPQYVIDHDLLAVPLGGRTVSAVRLRPVEKEPWGLGEVLLHAPAPPRAWEDWLPLEGSWEERRQLLRARPLRDREDWLYRVLLTERRGS